MPPTDRRILRAADMSPRQMYRFMTSVVVPRPIGWLSTRSAGRPARSFDPGRRPRWPAAEVGEDDAEVVGRVGSGGVELELFATPQHAVILVRCERRGHLAYNDGRP